MTPREKCSGRQHFSRLEQLMREKQGWTFTLYRSLLLSLLRSSCHSFSVFVSSLPLSSVNVTGQRNQLTCLAREREGKLFSIELTQPDRNGCISTCRSIACDEMAFFPHKQKLILFFFLFFFHIWFRSIWTRSALSCLAERVTASMQLSCKILSLVLNVNNFSLCTLISPSNLFSSFSLPLSFSPAFLHFATCRLLLFFLSLLPVLRLD